MRWDSKSIFIFARGVIALIGLVRIVVVIRLLTLPDYALIGVVESAKHVLSTLFGFGVGDSLSREGATETDRRRRGDLIAVSYCNSLLLSLPVGGAFLVIALFGHYIYSDPRLSAMLMAAFVISVLERLWLISLAALRILDRHREFIVFGVCYGLINAVLTMVLVGMTGVEGYFYAQIANGFALVMVATFVVARSTVLPSIPQIAKAWKKASLQLWGVSWFMYVDKGSMTLWRRLPVLISAPIAPAEVLGAVTAALDMAFKIHLLHLALSPLIIPRLSRAFSESTDRYYALVRNEFRDLVYLYLAAFVIAAAGWYWLGSALLTSERWLLIGHLFYLALTVEATLVAANVSSMCVLVPTKQIAGLTTPSIVLRLATFPIFFALLFTGIGYGPLILLSMILPGLAVAILYGMRARAILHGLPVSQAI